MRLHSLPIRYPMSRNMNTGDQSLVMRSRYIDEDERQKEEEEEKKRRRIKELKYLNTKVLLTNMF